MIYIQTMHYIFKSRRFCWSNVNPFQKASASPALTGLVIIAAALFFTSAEPASAGKVKKVQKGLSFAGKTLTKLEKAGRKAQKKRGIVSKVGGGILKNAAKGANKVVRGTKRGIGKASRGAKKLVSKSKVGRAAQKGYRKARRFQNKAIKKAFKKCRGKVCKGAKGVVNFAKPL